ncbi:hypothetical protein GCM10011390_50240 [Aureimonas endophytica]|uniref:Uncharacterized protein n=1 Tax=Aureimonas endophytica TaxID=2027858 RepID=A0A917A3A2_9HYPH|nr:hypothetical protein [Aureimonas endophytica]GGE24768.1 hypothetical protein GCM10011390_50240 [Aureimonas endophytica]
MSGHQALGRLSKALTADPHSVLGDPLAGLSKEGLELLSPLLALSGEYGRDHMRRRAHERPLPWSDAIFVEEMREALSLFEVSLQEEIPPRFFVGPMVERMGAQMLIAFGDEKNAIDVKGKGE